MKRPGHDRNSSSVSDNKLLSNSGSFSFTTTLVSFFYLNIRSLRNKSIELECLIDSLDDLPLLFLTETWLDSDDLDVLLPYYISYSIFRSDHRGG